MGVLTKLSAVKNTNSVEENAVQPHPIILSPAVSSITSYDSGSALVPGHQPKPGIKRKALSLTVGKRHVPAKLSNIIWSGLFLMVIIATVVVVATLAENIRRTLWTRGSFKYEGSSLQPIANLLEDVYNKIHKNDGGVCTHRRMMWEHGSHSSEIIHDLGSKWSAVVDHHEERCLIFDMHNSHVNGCPISYPWDMDLQVGVPACRGPLARIAPIRKIMHHICSPLQVNLTSTGETISTACSEYRILQVDRVIIQYYDSHFRRVAKRSIDPIIEESIKDSINFMKGLMARAAEVSTDQAVTSAVNPAREDTPTLSGRTLGVSTPDSRAIARFSKLVGNERIHPHPELSNEDMKSTDSPSKAIMKSHFENVINKIGKTTVISALTGTARNGIGNVRLSEPPEGVLPPDGYWDVFYNSVDEAANKILKARSLSELMKGF